MSEPIAIVGSACRFPGSASSPSKLWQLLRDPVDVLQDFSAERLKLSNFHSTDGEHHGSTDVQNKSYLLQEDCRLFDASFFRINPKEAHGMDPQQRLLLETVYESLEAAGCTLDQVQGSQTSVYVGVMTADWNDLQMRDTETMSTYTATGTSRSILSNRISYFFDLKGPSMTIDTACSSSLVALHQAVQSLRKGDSTRAVVAGSTLLLDPPMYIAESKLHMLSPDSRSRMWDSGANGYARGEGCASLLLKTLSQAIADGDHIECIVRETGVNSDGRTNGITMPDSASQADLIRRTYRAAGLDPVRDRCQFFECHGTGTLAGDPVEARAIRDAFFPTSQKHDATDKLFCGSIKTIVGHLEGCAGLAGILKASLAMQNEQIPPNMHFNKLNSKIEPFYKNLLVPTEASAWPRVPGQPLRASVNSFGFGGTNAHAILESYEADDIKQAQQQQEKETTTAGPFVFSAKTETSLVSSLKSFLAYIQSNETLHLDDLSWMLQTKRTTFPVRTTAAGLDRNQLVAELEKQINKAEASAAATIGTRALPFEQSEGPGVLGVFTGQGAQWATMGRDLIDSCALFANSIRQCERDLASLPDAPSWSLGQELRADETNSRLSEAALSQPLCTAIQIALVDLLTAAGLRFDAVVGHSSGEIAATYAAGIINARDAIRIAYYRGMLAYQAKGVQGQQGGMMAVGLSFDEASKFCARPEFAGRIGVAASNAPASVTLSGDLDAIKQAKVALDEDKTFARQLQVDTAYHSSHMLKCAVDYLECLRRCDIQISEPRDGCVWSSSVRADTSLLDTPMDELKGQYWVDNMVKPVLFSQALECSMWHGGPFDMAIEVGPHPALKGPTGQTFKAIVGNALPYTGCIARKEHGLSAFAAGLGAVWATLGPAAVDFDGYRSAFAATHQPRVLKGLPSYAWDHEQPFWRESRISRNYRLRGQQPHALLGRRAPDDSEHELRWRNVFRVNELPWTAGHKFQGQTIFPAAGYVSMAVQAAQKMAQGRPLRLVEVLDLSIPKGLVLGEDNTAGVETVFSVRCKKLLDVADAATTTLETDFACYMCVDESTTLVEKGCDGRMVIHFGEPTASELPPTPEIRSELPILDVDRFYAAVSGLGIDYTGPFRTLSAINRSFGLCKATASWPADDISTDYILHPAVLDVGFQGGLAAFTSIASDAMGTTYLPSTVERVLIDPNQTFRAESGGDVRIDIQAFVNSSSAAFMDVDVQIADPASGASGVQVQGLVLKGISEPRPDEDRLLLSKTVWQRDVAFGLETDEDEGQQQCDAATLRLIDATERVAMYYFQRLLREVKPDDVADLKWYHRSLFDAIDVLLQPVREGRHTVLKQEWLDDSAGTIDAFLAEYGDRADLRLMQVVGEHMAEVVRGESQMIEHMIQDDLLGRFYMEGRGSAESNASLAHLIQQIVHKHPNLDMLEIGAGTGGTTRSLLDAIGTAYSSYTYTDISAGFFEKATEKFADHAHKMTFKVLNAERDVAEQGFDEAGYDLIIAANVLHATRTLEDTMRHARSLLRPGGYLIAVEVTGLMLREALLMGTLEGWWLGVDDGRFPCPGVSPARWNEVLQATGFSGVDTIVYDAPDLERHNTSVWVAQATDQRLDVLRDPLMSIDLVPEETLLILGGKSLPTAKAVQAIRKQLPTWRRQTITATTLDDLDLTAIPSGVSVISLLELDEPVFSKPLTAARLQLLQELFSISKNCVWLTSGRLSDDPSSNMMVGIGRALMYEIPSLNLQFIDLAKGAPWNMDVVVESFLRLVLTSSLEYSGADMLWVTEPELSCSSDGVIKVSRIVDDPVANERLNSSRRRITKTLAPDAALELAASGRVVQASTRQASATQTEIEVQHSLALAPEGPYLVSGVVNKERQPALALAGTNSSRVAVDTDKLYTIPAGDASLDATTLLAAASQLVAEQALEQVSTNETWVLYNAPASVAEAAARLGSTSKANIISVTPEQTRGIVNEISIHPLTSTRAVQRLLPNGISSVVSFVGEVQSNIRSCLPATCSVSQALLDASPMTGATLAAVYARVKDLAPDMLAAPLSIVDLASKPATAATSPAVLEVVEWTRDAPVQVVVPPCTGHGWFSPDKTYLMVGAAGDLGQSLCRYMVEHGARHIVASSRSAVANAPWLQDLRASGADVRVMAMDVTDKAQVVATVAEIRRTMPPIGGVANAALVLEDSLFVNTTAESVDRQLKSKVDGSRNLDEVFARDQLDFFLVFSSLGSVFGNAGQSIYHAANLYMTGLVAQRRKRGVAGSVINIGLVIDAGYVARAGKAIEDNLRKNFFRPLAETDIHHLFLEGVMASDPLTEERDLIMGIQKYVHGRDDKKPGWYNNPRFSHQRSQEAAAEGDAAGAAGGVQQLRQQLDDAVTEPETLQALREWFVRKLEMMLKVPAASINVDAPLIELGLDSLLAVEIRTSFLKELQVDVPLLKILGQEPIAAICLDATKKFMHAKGASAPAATSDAPASKLVPQIVEPEPQQQQHVTVVHDSASSSDTASNRHDTASVSSADLSDAQDLASESSAPIGTPRIEKDIKIDTKEIRVKTQEIAVPDEPVEAGDKKQTDDKKQTSDLLQTKGREPLDLSSFERVEKMSYSQARLYFLQDFLQDKSTYNITVRYEIDGHVNVARLRRALTEVTTKHHMFRTCFFTEPGSLELNQGILPKAVTQLQHVTSATDADVQQTFDELQGHEWDLERGDIFQPVLMTRENTSKHSLIFSYHHIIMDGFSWSVFLQDLNQAYKLQPLPRIPKQYADFAADQLAGAQAGRFDEHLAFWQRKMSPSPDVLPLLPFARVRARKATSGYESHTISKEIDASLVAKIKRASTASRVTPFHFHLAVLQALFSKLHNVQDLCIGVTDANRADSSYARTIGFFLNLLPLRFDVDSSTKFKDLLGKTSAKVLAAYEHASVPFDLVLDRLSIPRSNLHSPLFQIAFNYRVGDLLQVPLGDCSLDFYHSEDARNAYDMALNVTQTNRGTCLVQVTSRDYLYTPETTQLVLDMYARLLETVTSTNSITVADMELWSDAQRQQALVAGRGERIEHAWPSTLTEQFNIVSKRHPSHLAIKDETEALTYKQLDTRANSIAAALLDHGIAAGSRVAVLCRPSVDTYASMLAIVRVGAVYVPLDLSLPAARHQAMADVCKPQLVIYHDKTKDAVESLGTSVKTLNTTGITAVPRTVPPTSLDGTAPAFLLFTSGSTGVPKGISLGQSGIMNYAAAKSDRLGLGQEVVMQQSSTGFDMSIAQAVNAWANGGTLVVVPRELRGDAEEIAKLMLAEQVTFTLGTPSEFLAILRYGNEHIRKYSSWRNATTGGEKITTQLRQEFGQIEHLNITVTDCYGPTEISCAATFETVPLITDGEESTSTDDVSSVGRSIMNSSIYIVDEAGKLLPAGFAGEICVGGRGVALGYVDPRISATRFVPDPFATAADVAKGYKTMYKTGDKGRLLADGSLVFLGRLDGDTMVKLRGLRIELEEVANAILKSSQGLIADAIVTVRGEPQYLVAHVVAAQGKTLDNSELQSIRKSLPLPRYMIPSQIVLLDRLPTSPNGKTDRKAVEKLELPEAETGGSTSAKLTLVEGELRLIWRDVLGRAPGDSSIGPDTDFFMAGGSSQLLVKLQNAIKERMGISVPLTQLYSASTLADMSLLVGDERGRTGSGEGMDWDAEVVVPQEIASIPLAKGKLPIRTQDREVLLTGATGFLGFELLNKLLADSSVMRIHCVAVAADARKKLPASPKIRIYTGTQLSPTLGLSSPEIESLSATVDQIIHAGATGHCLNNYRSIRAPNYLSTQFLASIAMARRIPLHFISSNRVMLLSGSLAQPPASMRSSPPPGDGSQGFTATKWASECFLEDLARQTGLPVAVHRACALVGDKAPHDDALNSLLRYSALMGAVPTFVRAEGWFDFKDVAEAAAEIVSGPVATPGASFRHHTGGVKVPVDGLRERMQLLHKKPFEQIDMDAWLRRAVELGIESLIVSYLTAVIESGQTMTFPYMGEQA